MSLIHPLWPIVPLKNSIKIQQKRQPEYYYIYVPFLHFYWSLFYTVSRIIPQCNLMIFAILCQSFSFLLSFSQESANISGTVVYFFGFWFKNCELMLMRSDSDLCCVTPGFQPFTVHPWNCSWKTHREPNHQQKSKDETPLCFPPLHDNVPILNINKLQIHLLFSFTFSKRWWYPYRSHWHPLHLLDVSVKPSLIKKSKADLTVKFRSLN